MLFAFYGKTIGQTTSGAAYIWSTTTSWTPAVVPSSTSTVTVNHPLTLDQDLTIGTGNYIFNQDVTDQSGGLNYNLTNSNASGSLTIASGTTTIGGITDIGGNATFTLTVKNGATLVLGIPGSTSNNFLIGNKANITIEQGATLIVYGNILNSNSTGAFTVNGLLQVYGDYITDNGNIDISGTTGQFYTTGAMTTQGNSSQIYGSSNNCTSNCSGTSLGCGSSGDSYTATITPQSQIVCSGGAIATMTFTTNAPSPTYEWQYSLTAGGTFTPISGANSNTYSPSSLTVTTWYRVKYTSSSSGCGTKYSAPIPVYVSASTYTQSTAGQTVCRGTFGPISVSAFGTALTYQWYSNNSASNSGGSLISGAISNIYTPSSAIGGTKYYYCVINSSCGTPFITAVSGAFTVNLNSVTAASSSPTPCVNTLMTNITHTTTGASGIGTAIGLPAGVSALWASNIITISGTPTQSGTFNYSIPLSGGCGSLDATGTITVNLKPSAPTITAGGPTTFCSGGSVTLTSSAGTSYLWSTGATTQSISPTTSGSYTVQVTNASGCQSSSSIATVVTVNSLPTAPTVGTITHPTCALATGSVVLSSLPASGTWTLTRTGTSSATTTGTGTSTTIPGLATGTYNFTVTNASGCTSSASANVVINAQPATPTAPAVSITQPTCTLSTGTIAITVQNIGETYSFDNGSTFQAGNSKSGLSAGSYNVIIKSASGCNSSTTSVIIKNATNIWNGSTWSNGTTPIITENVEFAGNYVSSTSLDGCSCQVNSGVFVNINSGHTLNLTNGLNVVGLGTIAFLDGASLLQSNTASNINSGDIDYQRSTGTAVRATDYVYWSSPVLNQDLGDLSSKTANGTYYAFDSNTENWNQVFTGTMMDAGKGYIVRSPDFISGIPVATAPYTASFVGVPNNGTIAITGIIADKSYLLGNPYPSAIDADTFLTANNGVLGGTIYFWTHNTAIQLANAGDLTLGSGAFAYTSNDYATYNITGGVGIDTGTSTGAAISGGTVPSGKIVAGQGFFASSLISPSTTTVNFTNAMRVAGNNTQFFKSRNPKTTKAIEKNRVWLNLTNTQGAFKQTLIGYITGATNDYDDRFDGESLDGNEFVDFYSVNQDKNLTIQGRALPFDENDEVPLGYRTTINGAFTINIDQVDGSLTNQAVFIEDKLTNTVTDLKSGNYTFNTVAGTFNDRFVLRYTNTSKTLAAETFDSLENKVLVSNKNKQIKINSFTETIDKVTIYDLLGRQIYQKNKVNNNELSIANLVSSRQTLIVKTMLQNGATVTDKIMY